MRLDCLIENAKGGYKLSLQMNGATSQHYYTSWTKLLTSVIRRIVLMKPKTKMRITVEDNLREDR